MVKKAEAAAKAQRTGPGLAIAGKFTEACGGAVTVLSRPVHGASFRAALPAPPGA